MTRRAAHTVLEEKLQALLLLNPDVAELQAEELYALAGKVNSRHFPRFRQIAQLLIEAYQDSPAKRTERVLLHDYLSRIEKAAGKLIAAGDMEPLRSAVETNAGSADGAASMALVVKQHFSTLDWFRVQTEARVPQTVMRAVDAFRRRNELLSSVLEIVFCTLLNIDPVKTVRWQIQVLEEQCGNLDQDLSRDIVLSWLQLDTLPATAIDWAHEWSASTELQHLWPNLVKTADRLLRRQAVTCWQQQEGIHTSNLDHLRMILDDPQTSEKRLFPWIEAAIQELGERVDFFVRLDVDKQSGGTQTWQSAALLREIRGIEAIFIPLMIHADMFFATPGGGYNFALAIFGLAGGSFRAWHAKLEKKAEAMVRTEFLKDLKAGVPPLQTFSRLAFKDPDLERQLLASIDFGTKQFDSLKQRDKAVRLLTVYHASQQQAGELDKEVSRRYRDLMRVLHADSFKVRLEPAETAEVETYTGLPELMSLVADARKFMSMRRALDASVEEMTAAEFDFAQSVRQRRLKLIRQLLLGRNQVA